MIKTGAAGVARMSDSAMRGSAVNNSATAASITEQTVCDRVEQRRR